MESLRWYAWHNDYDDLETAATRRLQVVQELLSSALDTAAAGDLRVISMCAGQARDLLPILIKHPRGRDVSATLVEEDPLNASFLLGAIGSTELTGIDVRVADAGSTDAYRDAGPADLLLLGGVFANIDADDTRLTVDTVPTLCRHGAVVVWSTYGPRLDAATEVLAMFETGGFTRIALHHNQEHHFLVAAHRYQGVTQEPLPGRRFFRFVDGS